MTPRRAVTAQVLPFDAAARASARAASLRYVRDTRPGFTRVKRGKKFDYFDIKGRKLTKVAELGRIRALAVPPAWTEVWICPHENGHIQAVGRDARGRKQYRYHARWSKARDVAKHGRMVEFAKRLQRVRAHCREQLRSRQLTRDKVLSALLCIADLTAIRVGNEEYARENSSFGLTTLRKRHVQVKGARVELCFRGKSGIARNVAFVDRQVALVVAQCRAMSGTQLFKYRDADGALHVVKSHHLNAYLRELIGEQFSVKDFRTWAATVRVAVELARSAPATSERASRSTILAAVRLASEHLGNTPAICRKSYVHPLIFEAYRQGRVLQSVPKLRVVVTGKAEVDGSYLRHENRVRRFLLELETAPRARAA